MTKSGSPLSAQQKRDGAFAELERAAIEGCRCPENDALTGMRVVPELARAGKIRIEIYAHNYRRVTILTGPNAGKSTAPHPGGLKPWKVIDANGTRTARSKFSVPTTRKTTAQPSAPRLLTREEVG